MWSSRAAAIRSSRAGPPGSEWCRVDIQTSAASPWTGPGPASGPVRPGGPVPARQAVTGSRRCPRTLSPRATAEQAFQVHLRGGAGTCPGCGGSDRRPPGGRWTAARSAPRIVRRSAAGRPARAGRSPGEVIGGAGIGEECHGAPHVAFGRTDELVECRAVAAPGSQRQVCQRIRVGHG